MFLIKARSQACRYIQLVSFRVYALENNIVVVRAWLYLDGGTTRASGALEFTMVGAVGPPDSGINTSVWETWLGTGLQGMDKLWMDNSDPSFILQRAIRKVFFPQIQIDYRDVQQKKQRSVWIDIMYPFPVFIIRRSTMLEYAQHSPSSGPKSDGPFLETQASKRHKVRHEFWLQV